MKYEELPRVAGAVLVYLGLTFLGGFLTLPTLVAMKGNDWYSERKAGGVPIDAIRDRSAIAVGAAA